MSADTAVAVEIQEVWSRFLLVSRLLIHSWKQQTGPVLEFAPFFSLSLYVTDECCSRFLSDSSRLVAERQLQSDRPALLIH